MQILEALNFPFSFQLFLIHNILGSSNNNLKQNFLLVILYCCALFYSHYKFVLINICERELHITIHGSYHILNNISTRQIISGWYWEFFILPYKRKIFHISPKLHFLEFREESRSTFFFCEEGKENEMWDKGNKLNEWKILKLFLWDWKDSQGRPPLIW